MSKNTDKPTLEILYLYPNEMNIYSDTGNVLALQRRLEWRGYGVKISYHHPGETFKHKPDIIIGGGGQDSGQLKVCEDLQKIGSSLHKLADADVPMLVICGTYQLFGHRFVTNTSEELPGIGIFDAETIGSQKRLIGNIIVDTPLGQIVGYENHSGQTWLKNDQQPLGTVLAGFGNNGEDKTEGARYKNTIGSYLHGSVLPKNPKLADDLIRQALINRGEPAELTSLEDSLATISLGLMKKRLL